MKLTPEDLELAVTTKYSDARLLQPVPPTNAEWWVDRFEAEARRLNLRIREKPGNHFDRWSRASTALGWAIRFAVGFSKRSAERRAYGWAHELHHIRWQRAVGRIRWLWWWLTNPVWRLVVEVAALRDEYMLRATLAPDTTSYRAKLLGLAAREAKSFVVEYRLTGIEDAESIVHALLVDALKEAWANKAQPGPYRKAR